jgi:hypothetical protein
MEQKGQQGLMKVPGAPFVLFQREHLQKKAHFCSLPKKILMRPLLLFLLLLSLSLPAIAQTPNPNYDPALAEKLGADDYGMKSYVLVILQTGSNDTTDQAFISQCFRGHFENMTRMAEAGKLVVAGPIGKNDHSYRGIFILNTTSFEEAYELLQGDAAIANKLLEPLLFNWYGSAALPEYLDASDKIWKVKP